MGSQQLAKRLGNYFRNVGAVANGSVGAKQVAALTMELAELRERVARLGG